MQPVRPDARARVLNRRKAVERREGWYWALVQCSGGCGGNPLTLFVLSLLPETFCAECANVLRP